MPLREGKPTSAISALYATLLTSPQTGAAWTAIELASPSPTSLNTDEAALLEAASAVFCASAFIFAEIAWNHCTKIVDWCSISSCHSPGITSSSQLDPLMFLSIASSFWWN